MRPMSPMRNQPCGQNAAAVSSGRRQYPGMIIGPRAQTSPSSPMGTELPSGSRMSMPTVAFGRPTESGCAASSGPTFEVSNAAVSVEP
jgi:hypothetical protein